MPYSQTWNHSLLEFIGYRLSHKQQALISEAATIALRCLVSQRMIKSLDITIEITKDMYKKTGTWGNCGLEDDSRSPKFFIIELNYSGKESFAALINTLCHELVHVAQYAQRRMRHLSRSYSVAWGSSWYNTNDTEYMDRPWEIEAHALESELYGKVKESIQIKKYIDQTFCPKFEKRFNPI